MPILEAKGVTRYFGGLAAVSNVDFEVRKGEVLGLIGPNGAGKTTLFNLISAALSPQIGLQKALIRVPDLEATGREVDLYPSSGIRHVVSSLQIRSPTPVPSLS